MLTVLNSIVDAISPYASIFGLLISIFTLIRVWNIKKILRDRDFDKTTIKILNRIEQFPIGKSSLTPTNAKTTQDAVKHLRSFYVSKIPFVGKKLKKLISAVEDELKKGKRTQPIQDNFELIRSELFQNK